MGDILKKKILMIYFKGRVQLHVMTVDRQWLDSIITQRLDQCNYQEAPICNAQLTIVLLTPWNGIIIPPVIIIYFVYYLLVASFTKEVNPRLVKSQLKTNERLADRRITSLLK